MIRFRSWTTGGVMVVAAIFALGMPARATLPAQQLTTRAAAPVRVRVPMDIISPEQLHAHPELATAYSVVQSLRSNWLLVRNVGPSAGFASQSFRIPDGARAPAGVNAGVQVYVDGHRLGGVELLRNIPARGVYSIRHLNGIEAQASFGAGHSEGVIFVATGPGWEHVR